MRKILFSAILMLFAKSAFAALSPLNQSATEIIAIMKDAQMQKNFGNEEKILNVIKTESGYLILTEKSYMPVDVAYSPQNKPGPQKFELKFRPSVPFSP